MDQRLHAQLRQLAHFRGLGQLLAEFEAEVAAVAGEHHDAADIARGDGGLGGLAVAAVADAHLLVLGQVAQQPARLLHGVGAAGGEGLAVDAGHHVAAAQAGLGGGAVGRDGGDAHAGRVRVRAHHDAQAGAVRGFAQALHFDAAVVDAELAAELGDAAGAFRQLGAGALEFGALGGFVGFRRGRGRGGLAVCGRRQGGGDHQGNKAEFHRDSSVGEGQKVATRAPS
ncbi:MAG: hypothetical protein A2X76_08335 [Lysobacterales bacterium GWF1_69_6]|nr:MAG: hypothetical protein A2X76_08335 [Xanthomonadales bacterium GWF1_69_6]